MATKLTARGRSVVRGTAVASLLIVIGAGFSAVGNASEKNGVVPGSGHAGYSRVVVAPGESLWSLASMVAGSGSVTAVEQEIVDANQLGGTDLAAGARLWVPVK